MKYTIYNSETGLFSRFVDVPEDLIDIQLAENEAYVEEWLQEFTHIIDGKPEKIILEPNIKELKDSKLNYLKYILSETLTSNSSSYTTIGLENNITVNARKEDLENAKNLRDILVDKNQNLGMFRCFDNSFVELTVTDLDIIISELKEYGLSLYQKKWQLEAALEAATTKEEIDAIVW